MKDGKWITKYLDACTYSYSLVAEIGSHANFHWHVHAKVKEPVKWGIFLKKWRQKKGFFHEADDAIQKKRNVPWISGALESKLNLHIYMRKFCDELPSFMKMRRELSEQPFLKILTKLTSRYRRLWLKRYLAPKVIDEEDIMKQLVSSQRRVRRLQDKLIERYNLEDDIPDEKNILHCEEF